MRVIIDQTIDLGEKRRLIRKLYKLKRSKDYPTGLKYCLQYLYYRDKKWLEIARIDNYLHQKTTGSHIHFFNKKEVKWKKLNFTEAEQEIEKIADKIINLLQGEINEN